MVEIQDLYVCLIKKSIQTKEGLFIILSLKIQCWRVRVFVFYLYWTTQADKQYVFQNNYLILDLSHLIINSIRLQDRRHLTVINYSQFLAKLS